MKKCSLRRLIAIMMVGLLVLSFASCHKSGKQTNSQTKNPVSSEKTDDKKKPKEEKKTAPQTPDAQEGTQTGTQAGENKGTQSGGNKKQTVPAASNTSSSSTNGGENLPIIKLPNGATFKADRNRIYGIGYVEDQMNNRVSVDQAVYLLRSMGTRSVRIWATCYSDSHTLVKWHADLLHELAQKLKAAKIQVIFVTYWFESPERPGLSTFIPRRNMTAGSNYQIALQNWEDLCYMMTKEFPEVDCWELGNEWNHTGALNPTDYTGDEKGGDPFTIKEKADITCDLTYRTMRAAKKAGSKSTMILPAMAPSDGMDGIAMTDYLEYVYKNIESGKFGSANPRDFFDALAWHPYLWDEAPDLEWVKNNNRVYQIAINHGDAGIPVYLTELGYSDNKNSRADATQAEWLTKTYELVLKYMPYVESLHYYRMFTDTSRGMDYYGLMNQPEDGFDPKAKGLAYQKMAGGKGDLYRFYMPLDD